MQRSFRSVFPISTSFSHYQTLFVGVIRHLLVAKSRDGRQKGIELDIIHRLSSMNIQKLEVVVKKIALLHR